MKRLALCVLWPAFFTAGVLDAMVFAVLDPRDLRWFGGGQFGWSPVAVHSVTFLIFWAAITAAAATTALLLLSDAEVNALGASSAGSDAIDASA
jgi:hypothetical protein